MKASSISPSTTTELLAIQVWTVILLVMPQNKTKRMAATKNAHTTVCRAFISHSLVASGKLKGGFATMLIADKPA